MIKFKKTLNELKVVGQMLKVGLQKELIAQKHNATGRLSRGLKYHIKGNVLNIHSSVSYWKAVNNPKFAKTPNYNAIASWARAKKGIEATSASITRIYAKMLRQGYGQPYVFWTERKNLRSTNFSGSVAKKLSKEKAKKIEQTIV